MHLFHILGLILIGDCATERGSYNADAIVHFITKPGVRSPGQCQQDRLGQVSGLILTSCGIFYNVDLPCNPLRVRPLHK